MFNFIFQRKKYTTLFSVLLLMTNIAHATFHKSLWPKWEMTNPLSKEVISHQEWQDFLSRYVQTNEEGINLVNYAAISDDDLVLLKNYVKRLSEIDIDNYNRNEQLAFWINLYNALTVLTVKKHFPVSNIQEINISPGLFSVGPWGAHLLTMKGSSLTLDDINNRIIRPIWNDPRTHYTLNNATIGAPNLNKVVYNGATIDAQLNSAATAYVNSLRGVQVIEGKLIISKIYDWYEDDFGDSKQNVIKHLLQYAKEPLLSQLKHINSIDSYIYNWHINSPPIDAS